MPIILTVLGFMWWWPLGLLLLALFIGRGKFGCWRRLSYAGEAPMFERNHDGDHWDRKVARLQEKMDRIRERADRFRSRGDWFGPATSGNRAFDDYRSETLKRLEEEQREFKDFLGRLRFARDRAEFDQFMAERRSRPFEPDSQAQPPVQPRD
jgi:erythromycin esterase-like protein